MATPETPKPPQSFMSTLNGWGLSSMPPLGLATLITALHWRPLQKLPMFFTPMLLFSSYMNVAGFKIDSAGFTAAWSGIGAVRGAAMGLGTINAVAGGWAYATGDRETERAQRKVWGA